MATHSSVLLQFQRPEGRIEFDRARRELKTQLRDASPEAAASRLLDFGASLDSGVARLKRDLVGSQLCWNEDSQQLTKWIHQQHAAVTELALRTLEPLRAAEPHGTLTISLGALVLYHWGETLKWTLSRERQDYAAMHTLFTAFGLSGRHRETFSWAVDGRGHKATLEGLYFRALLLDRFHSGSLTRQQVEILDAWLWRWMEMLRGERTRPEGPALRVDLDQGAGLRDGPREGDGASLYLALAPLEARRRDIVLELHCGRIVPSHGCVAEFRIEEHIEVLDQLRLAFAPVAGAPQRAARTSAGRARVEVWVGLPEILFRGAGIGTETGRYRALNLSDPAIENHAKSRYSDATRRYLWLVDASATGLGFEALESDAEGIEAGDLVGWRRTTSAPLQLARVMRRMPTATSGQVFIGVHILTESAQPLKLSQVVSFDNGNADGTYLFVPGADDSGSRDSFIVPESTYDLQATYNAHVANDSFSIQFNRVRMKGRGWMLAGFEVLPPQSAQPVKAAEVRELPTLDFKLELENEIDDPWGSEVSARLMS